MRRPLLWSIAVVLALLVAAPSPSPPTAAQGTPTVAAGDGASGGVREVLLQAALQELPTPPAFLRLARITLQPGASVPAHTHPGPEFGRIETGTLTVRVDGDAVLARAGGGGDAPSSQRPPNGEAFELRPGDQIVYPAGVAIAWRNAGAEATSLLALLVVPAGEGQPPASRWVEGTPGPNAAAGVTSRILGDAVTPGWPPAPVAVVLDRLALAPGESIPAREGPVLLAVELGSFGFALVDGEFQVSRGGGPQPSGTPGAAYALGPGEAVFFPGGVTEVPRPDDGVLVLLRLSVTSLAPSGATPAADEPSGSAAFPPGVAVAVGEPGVRLRDAATAAGAVVAELARGRKLFVTGPPVAVDGIAWYPVRAADDPALAGFVAEAVLAPAGAPAGAPQEPPGTPTAG